MTVAIRDVESNARNVRNYIIKFQKSKHAIDEFEVLPESIIGALKGFDDDILAVKRLLPHKPADKIKEKIQWALNKNKAASLTRRLDERNTRLVAALEITGR